MDTKFSCEISAQLQKLNSSPTVLSSFEGFRPIDLKSPRFEHHTFSSCAEAHLLGAEEYLDIALPHTLPTFDLVLNSVVGTEIFYETQILMCYPFGLKPDKLKVSLSITTGHGNVVLLDGIDLHVLEGGPSVFCCASDTKNVQYIGTYFPVCSLDSIINSVWFRPPLSDFETRGEVKDARAGRPYLKMIIAGSLPFTVEESNMTPIKSHMDNMKLFFKQGSMSDVTVNGIPCHKAILAGQSDVFERMLSSDMTEKNSGKIVLEESTAAVESLLKFIYYCDTSELDSQSDEVIVELILLAHRFIIPALLQSCANALLTRPGGESALDLGLLLNLFDFAQRAELAILEETIVCIFKRKQSENSEVVKSLVKSNPEIAAQLIAKTFSNMLCHSATDNYYIQKEPY